MNFTFTTHVGDGTTTVFSFSFAGQDTGYIAESNLAVFVDGVTTAFTVNRSDPNKVYLSTAPAAGKQVIIRRIMPKSVPYTDFKRGNAFTQDNLNRSFLQQLYVTQEMLDGYLPDGFYYKQDVNMGGYNIKNLGDAVDPDDAIKKEVTDGLSDRLTSLEGDMSAVVNKTVPWNRVATGPETVLYPPYVFDTAMLFINGVTQTPDKAYIISNNTIILAGPLKVGDQVFALIGDYPATPVADNNPTIHWSTISAGGEVVLAPPYTFNAAALFINGVAQTPNVAYAIANDKVYLAEPLLLGDEVLLIIGDYQAPLDIISATESGLLFAALSAGVPVSQTYMAVVGEQVVNALAFFDGVRVYKTAAPLTGTVTAVNLPNITVT